MLVLVEVTIDTDGVIRLGATELVSGERVTLEQVYHAGLARADVARLAEAARRVAAVVTRCAVRRAVASRAARAAAPPPVKTAQLNAPGEAVRGRGRVRCAAT